MDMLNELSKLWESEEWGPCLRVALGAAGAVAGMVILIRQRAASRTAALRAEWDSAGKDVVVLHMFDRALTSPNPSPFPIKIETYLRIAGIKYVADFKEPLSKKNKSPWITLNGVDMSDSQLSIEYITKTLGKDIEAHLSGEEKAVSTAFRLMIEDHFYWCLVLDRWVYGEGQDAAAVFPPIFPAYLPKAITRYLYKRAGATTMYNQAHGAGIGRHSRQEVEGMGRNALKALTVQLGSKPFLLGDKPCLADLSLFGFMCMLTMLLEENNSFYRKIIPKEFPSLFEHHQRMVDKYWPDYETARYGKE